MIQSLTHTKPLDFSSIPHVIRHTYRTHAKSVMKINAHMTLITVDGLMQTWICSFDRMSLTSVLHSVGPLYATIQEYIFKQTDKQIVRILDNRIYRSIFWKTKEGT